MKKAARRLDFDQAADLRDEIRSLRKLQTPEGRRLLTFGVAVRARFGAGLRRAGRTARSGCGNERISANETSRPASSAAASWIWSVQVPLQLLPAKAPSPGVFDAS